MLGDELRGSLTRAPSSDWNRTGYRRRRLAAAPARAVAAIVGPTALLIDQYEEVVVTGRAFDVGDQGPDLRAAFEIARKQDEAAGTSGFENSRSAAVSDVPEHPTISARSIRASWCRPRRLVLFEELRDRT